MSISKLAMSVFVLFSIVMVSASASAQQFEHTGLKQQWYSHSGIASGGKLSDWYLDVDENKGTTFFEITGGDYSETFSENDLGPNGEPMGVDFGLEMANIKAEVVAARLKSDNNGKEVPVSVNQYTLPKSTLYTQTDRGVIRAYDAETGKIRWSVTIGESPSESLGLVAKGQYVAAIKGGTVYCIDSETGSTLWSHRCETAPSAPPQIAGEHIFVPLISGRIERFDVTEKGFNTVSYVSGGTGSATVRPAISAVSFCWANYSGKVSVASRFADRGMPGFQLNANNSVLGAPKYKNGIYFVTSLDGYVYALSEVKGSLIWENSTGFEITQSPILLGKYVYVINNLDQLSRFEATTGLQSADWQEPRMGIGSFAGASQTRIYTVDKIGTLKVLDQNTGEVLSSASLGPIAMILPNSKTDRIYLLNNAGTIRCYSETRSERPYFHSDEFKEMKPTDADDKDETDGSEMKSPGPDDENPFGDDNPFGEDVAEEEDMVDDDASSNDDKSPEPDDDGDDDNPFESDSDDPFQ